MLGLVSIVVVELKAIRRSNLSYLSASGVFPEVIRPTDGDEIAKLLRRSRGVEEGPLELPVEVRDLDALGGFGAESFARVSVSRLNEEVLNFFFRGSLEVVLGCTLIELSPADSSASSVSPSRDVERRFFEKSEEVGGDSLFDEYCFATTLLTVP